MNKNQKILFLLPPAFLYPLGAGYVAATLENADYDIYGFFYDNRAWFKRNLAAQKGTHDVEGIQNKSARVFNSCWTAVTFRQLT